MFFGLVVIAVVKYIIKRVECYFCEIKLFEGIYTVVLKVKCLNYVIVASYIVVSVYII